MSVARQKVGGQHSGPDIPSSVDPNTGITLLNKQVEKAKELLAKRPISTSDHRAWGNTTRDYLIRTFGSASPNVNAVLHATSDHDFGMGDAEYEQYEASMLANQIKMLESCIEQLKTNIELAEVSVQARGQYELGDLHPEILEKCQQLFETGTYAEAVEKGFKVVRDRLRQLTGFERGSDAFGKGKLHIKGAAAQNVDDDFNEGVKFLTMAIDYFRNEKSHTSNAKVDEPSRAHEYLKLSSLAMHLLDQAEILP